MRRRHGAVAAALLLTVLVAGPAAAAPPSNGPPTGLRTTAVTQTTVGLRWDPTAGATSYKVLRGVPGGVLAVVGSPTTTTFSDTGLSAGLTYVYAVSAVRKTKISAPSESLTVTTVPAAPAGVTGIPQSSTEVLVTWADSIGATSYQVWRGTGGSAPVLVATVPVPAGGGAVPMPDHEDSGLSPGTVYTYTIRAVNGSGVSPASAPATVTTPSGASSTGFAPYRAFATGSWPESVVAADVNGDGRVEAVVATTFYFDEVNDYSLFVHDFVPGTAAPTVTRIATGNGYTDSAAAAAGDLDGDGFDDVVVGTGAGVKVFAGSAGGLGGPALVPTTGDVRDVLVAEVTGDAHQDVVVALKGATGGEVRVLPGVGDRTFSAAELVTLPRTSTPTLATGDVSGDGHDDVVALWREGTQRIVEVVVDFGLASGERGNWDTWALRTLDTGGWGAEAVAVGDVSGDSRPDVVVTVGGNTPTSAVLVLQRDPAGQFLPQQRLSSYDIPEPVAVADLSGDGRGDVVTAHGGWNRVGVYRQGGVGGLGPEELYPVPYASHYSPRALALGDVSGDGRLDVLLADYNHGLVLLAGT